MTRTRSVKVTRKEKRIQFPLRVRESLHKRLKQAATRNDVSWNREANRRLEESFHADGLLDLVAQRLKEPR